MKRRLRRVYRVALGCVVAVAAVADWMARRRVRASRPLPVRRILVIRFGLLGDGTALLSPALQRLKALFAASEVHVLATPLQRPLLAALPFVDAVIPWTAGDLLEPRQALRPGAWRAAAGTVATLRRRRYDLALACYGPLTSAVALWSGVPRRIGFAAEAFPLALTDALPGGRYSRGWHEADYSVALANAAAQRWGGDARKSSLGAFRPRPEHGDAQALTPDGPPMRLVVEDAARAEIGALLSPDFALSRWRGTENAIGPTWDANRRQDSGGAQPTGVAENTIGPTWDANRRLKGRTAPGTPPPEAPVVLLPGATNGQAKRWPVAHWAELTRRLVAGGTGVVLAGGPEDRSLARAIRGHVGQLTNEAGAGVVDLVGRTTLPQLLALLERASVVVSGDSGPLHLAIALGRPAVAIYGPTDLRQSGPYRATNVTVLRHELPCSPCYRLDRVADCPLGHTLCQHLVTPPRVYNAVQDRLASPSPAPPRVEG